MKHALLLAAALGLLFTGVADATLVRKKDSQSSAAGGSAAAGDTMAGGVDIAPAGSRVRVQCWQDGHKIIDESDLAVVSLSIASQINGLRFRRSGGPDGTVSVTTQSRTTCLLVPLETKGRGSRNPD